MTRPLRWLLPVWLLASCAPIVDSTELYPDPWPDERWRAPDGTVNASAFPRGTNAPIRHQSVEALDGMRGFGLASAILFPFDVSLDPETLPGVFESVGPDSTVFLVNVDAESRNFGRRAPIDVRFLADAGPFGGRNLLVVLPHPGLPLAPDTLYAAFVTRDVQTIDGHRLDAVTLDQPTPAHREASVASVTLGIEARTLAARAVFQTGDPTLELRNDFTGVSSREHPTIDSVRMVEAHDTYCVFRASVEMPVYQGGEPPYLFDGGGFVRDEDGVLVVQARRASRVWITVPRRAAPSYPSAVFIRAGGGGDRPLVDRGPRDREGVSTPGTGIARELSAAGYVGLSVDGPLGGARNIGAWDEQTAMFNLVNPIALRDNVRQSALELALFAEALEGLSFDAADCDGASERVVVDSRPVLIGHSTGATIAPIAAAIEPRYHTLIMSGAGASWIRQIVHKASPERLRPIADVLFGYWPHRQVHEHDPLLSLVQWAGEPADPMVYAPLLADRNVLVFQGVLDTYIPPPIANPMALSLDLDLAGDALDEALPYSSLTEELPLTGGAVRALPTSMDESGRTRVVTQLPEDGLEDGHEVLFQRDDARHRLRCFLETLASGAPTLVASESDGHTCGAVPW